MRKTFAAVYSVLLLMILLWPVPVDQSGTTNTLVTAILRLANQTPGFGWLDYNFLESAANIVLFMPFGFLGTQLRPQTSPLFVALLGVAVSLSAELLQLFVITQRVFSLDDILHNSLGAAIGVALATWWGRTRSI
jgi:glycopeptide antibiotics resistance protein